MFRNILINEKDQKYQHILWRTDPKDPVQEFTLLTVTYGTTPAPYQSQRTLKQLVLDEGDNFPLAIEVLTKDIYIDDVATGADTIEEAKLLKNHIIGIFAAGEFTLSKWTSNSPLLLSDVSEQTTSSPVTFDELESSVKILGLHWDPIRDDFSYNVVIPHPVFTKRAILSAIGRIYDPLGYLGPVTFLAKTVLQETWKSAIGWDDEVPTNLQSIWENFLQDLPSLTDIKIPRYIKRDQSSCCSVFGFADASSKGCCAALYLRVQSSDSSKLYLLRSKTKLAPIKQLTIPRLELIAALLLAQLYSSTKDYLEHFNVGRITLFTDAAIVLGWLKTPSYQLKTFIANRVVKILDLTEFDWWCHVPSEDNPADCGTRGLLPTQLLHHTLWWRGPAWIHRPVEEWPSAYKSISSDELPELKKTVFSLVSTDVSSEDYSDLISITEGFSSYSKLIRVIAYILRFRFNTLSKQHQRRRGVIMSEEFIQANLTVIRCLQHHYYPEAFDKNRKWSILLGSLRAFIDHRGLLRVGGRISNSELSPDQKHPLLLPRRSHFTSILIDFYHKIYLHVGPSALQAIINRNYWIPSSKTLIKQRKRLCVTCTRFSKQHLTPVMGDMPAIRFTEVRPFFVTGVDFAGPFLVKETARRNSPINKAYLSLFVCLSTKALFLELVNALTTEAFIDALEIFISRRGSPSIIISDRGTNFIGTSNYLKEVESWINREQTRSDLLNFGSTCGIKWQFQPPSSPHFGGLYEAGVKSVKSLLVKTLGAQPYQVSQLRTIFAKIEAVLNSRPLYPASSDPTDLQPLTPAHFLIGEPITPLVEEDVSHIPSNRLSHWQHLRERVQSFWKRWRSDYLVTLQRRNKWMQTGETLIVGDMVLVSDANQKPYHWPLARIVETFPGKDGVVRVVSLRTSTGTYKRPVVKLIPLRQVLHAHPSTPTVTATSSTTTI